jgi:hypothetical protein
VISSAPPAINFKTISVALFLVPRGLPAGLPLWPGFQTLLGFFAAVVIVNIP